jgi:hypothetical protein
MKRRILILAFVLFVAPLFALAQCSNTDFGHGVTCVGGSFNGGTGTAQTTISVSYSPTAGRAVSVLAYWCAHDAGDDCLQAPTQTLSISDNINSGGEPCFYASPSSPMYLAEVGAQQIGNYIWACSSIPAGVTSFTLTCSPAAACDYMALLVYEWIGLASVANLFDSDSGCASTAVGTSFSCNILAASYTNDLVLSYMTTISDYSITWDAPSGMLTILNFGGTFGAITVAAAGTHTVAGHWGSSDSWTVMQANLRTASGSLSSPAPARIAIR